jgi:hypothetical protein
MDQIEDPRDLERKIEQASQIASRVTDQTTYQRLTAWVAELKQKLQKRLADRRTKEEVRVRAYLLWEQHGRPFGRDEEFWLQAEKEIREAKESRDAELSGRDPIKANKSAPAPG